MHTATFDKNRKAEFGKKVFDELYIHKDYLTVLFEDDLFQALIKPAIAAISEDDFQLCNVAKINIARNRLSFLQYLNFEKDPFPILNKSWVYDAAKQEFSLRSYESSINPPILHRKELLVGDDHPLRTYWAGITKSAEELGLFSTGSPIGFKLNWLKLISSKGFYLIGDQFHPIGNQLQPTEIEDYDLSSPIQRHLTALSRSSLSAPIQLMISHGLISKSVEIFDYGCGKGDDIKGLEDIGFKCSGWDPHFANDKSLVKADIVNLGFVVNVIEDPVERVEAIQKSFNLARTALVVSVMLHSKDRQGKPYLDGFITARKTFQKYFTQVEFKDYLENILGHEPIMIGPGIAVVFSDKVAEQRFLVSRYRSSNVARRLLSARLSPLKSSFPREPKVRILRVSNAQKEYELLRPYLEKLWTQILDLGRFPEAFEFHKFEMPCETISLVRAKRLIKTYFDLRLLAKASKTRSDEIKLFLAARQFGKKSAYKEMDISLKTDIKHFFGDYKTANQEALNLLLSTANTDEIRNACIEAAADGLGWLEENSHSLQLHCSLIERLPILLRAYVTCGLILWDNISDFQLIKIHVLSGKLTLLQYADFETQAIPLLLKRIKINIPKLDYEVFEYELPNFTPTPLLFKSRYMHEDIDGYAEQVEFDEKLDATRLLDDLERPYTISQIYAKLNLQRLEISGFKIQKNTTIPSLGQRCGQYLTFRDLIKCGETQSRLEIPNLPLNPETYNSLYELCVEILDPVIDYFGAIKLTYGFCSPLLSAKIGGKIAPKLDQHASCEFNTNGKYICSRKGAAVDFLVEDESMLEVARWMVNNVKFDRIYYYGKNKPIHVSFGPENSRQIVLMPLNEKTQKLIPKAVLNENFLKTDIYF
jgi:DNA phosphorothioation-associated putative methyltransferase